MILDERHSVYPVVPIAPTMWKQIYRYSSLARSIDLRYHSNRSILIVAALMAVLGLVGFGPADGAGGLGGAVAMGGAAFGAWALGRELDPDQPASALVGALAAGGLTMWLGAPALLVLAAVAVMARLLLRSVGPAPTWLDVTAVAILGIATGARPGGWPVALVLAFALARDRQLPGEAMPLGRSAAVMVAGGATGVAVATGVGEWMMPSAAEWVVLGAAVAAGAMTKIEPPFSASDAGGAVLSRARLASARRLTLGAVALAGLLGGAAGIRAVAAAAAAILAVFVVQRRIVPVGMRLPPPPGVPLPR